MLWVWLCYNAPVKRGVRDEREVSVQMVFGFGSGAAGGFLPGGRFCRRSNCCCSGIDVVKQKGRARCPSFLFLTVGREKDCRQTKKACKNKEKFAKTR